MAAKKTIWEKLKTPAGVLLTIAISMILLALSIVIIRGDGFEASIKHDGSEASISSGKVK